MSAEGSFVGRAASLAVALFVFVAPLTARAEPPVTKREDVPWLPWAITGALATGTVAAAIVTTNHLATYESEKQRFGVTPSALADAQSGARSWFVTTAALGVATVVVGALSLHWTLSRDRVAVAVGPGHVWLKGTF